MEYVTICTAALFGSALTLISGFGLGTILVPVFAIFFPVEVAIALTAVVHFFNNIFKLLLLYKHVDKQVIIRFGVPAIVASFAGAYLLTILVNMQPLFQYTVSAKTMEVMPVKFTVGVLLVVFALFEIVPKFSHMQFAQKYLPVGGLLSGFFGGLSGNQGAFRSAFLIKANLSKEAFIATGVVIACLIDVSRLTIYSNQLFKVTAQLSFSLLLAATLSAFLGAYAGNKLVKKVTITTIQHLVAAVLLAFGGLMAAGVI